MIGYARMYCQVNFGLPVVGKPFKRGITTLHSFSSMTRMDSSTVTHLSQSTADSEQSTTLTNRSLVWNARSKNSLPDRVLLLDGKAMVYRAYYRITSRVSKHSMKSVTRGDSAENSGWDSSLTTVVALNEILNLLELDPSHAAVVFDYPGQTFRHTLLPEYKGNRSPTPDTVWDAVNFTKAALLSMGVQVVEVPGVEADDVIATLASEAVEAGMKVRIVSPDKDFFQILSPQVRLLRYLPQGSGFVSFGVEEFGQKFPGLLPSQHVDMQALVGDRADNIPGVKGIGDVTARKLIIQFGTLENLLRDRALITQSRARTTLLLDTGEALLSKKLLLLRLDVPAFAMQCSVQSLRCKKPKDVREYTKLVEALVDLVGTTTSDNLLERTVEYWRRLETQT
ncbi:hypothetical protein MPTK1_1g18170 [Marchantia polymorpha subsp. ruderalis]|uniref:5'-3' exonuclease domain-containing protein n=4 Tax=Marchantia polymorpha TaxID=3197 RepID=A0AAF6ARG5_MARPO|nr:hypothetical protein MARPO_0001s0155 [Marchantia polymorpha]BBM99035.1 hypothetical protein Mp_1g18170 [Marchantia polymorpha subsp. ruderalis]|eukprot:PTQ50111.1 hypothetical protein MARPO_0001s0155 [Marchantia polymorpha]